MTFWEKKKRKMFNFEPLTKVLITQDLADREIETLSLRDNSE